MAQPTLGGPDAIATGPRDSQLVAERDCLHHGANFVETVVALPEDFQPEIEFCR